VNSARALRIGLTGGIASGKSTIARFFLELGATVVDTDELARAAVEPGQPALAEIKKAFGGRFMGRDGSLDRRALRAFVFSDKAARLKLESILHPRIEQAARAACAAARTPYVILVVPLLIESGMTRMVDRVLVVDCLESTQRARLIARDHETAEQADRILSAQLSREARLARADDVLNGDAPLTQVRAEVARLHEKYLSLAAATLP
jgi:dephospho-CoA kinase